MIKNIMFLKPFLIEKEWGNNDFKQFGYYDDDINAGELILLSDGDNYSNHVINSGSSFDNISLLYRLNKKYFNSSTGKIPYEIKIINPKITSPLMFSPDNYNGRHFHLKRGKKKIWISLKDNSVVNIGLNQETNDAINETLYYNCYNEYQKYCNQIKLNNLECINIPEHSINSIEPNSLIYEISFEGDFEYNLSDISDVNGDELRYIEKSIRKSDFKHDIYTVKNNGFIYNSNVFRVQLLDHIGLEYYTFKNCTVAHVFVLEGEGRINSYNVSKGSNIVIKNNEKFMAIGVLKLLITYIKDFN